MKPIDYVIIGVLVVALIGISIHLIRRKKQGKNGCGCGCVGCPSAANCPSIKRTENQGETE